MSPELAELLRPQQSVAIPLLDYCSDINHRYGEYLLPMPRGIYLRDSVEPAVVEDEVYYTESSYRYRRPILSIERITEAILDSSGRTVIPQYAMQRKSRYLLAEPNIPARALKLIQLLTESTIDEVVMYKKSPLVKRQAFSERDLIEEAARNDYMSTFYPYAERSDPREREPYNTAILNQFRPECRGVLQYGELETYCRPVITAVVNFIAGDLWYVHSTRMVGTIMILEKASDYRAIEWTKQAEAAVWGV